MKCTPATVTSVRFGQERGEIEVIGSTLGKPPEFVEREHLKFD